MHDVLVIEDHDDTRHVLVRLLRRLGLEVHEPSSCAAAADVLAYHGEPEIVIGDVGLPDCDGADLMRELKQRTGCALIALTGHAMPVDLIRYRSLGIDRVLIKPVGADAVQKALEDMLGVRLPLAPAANGETP